MGAVIVVLVAAVCLIAVVYFASRRQGRERLRSLTDDSDSTALLNTGLLGGGSNCSTPSHPSHGHGGHHSDTGSHHGGMGHGHVDTGHFDGWYVDAGGHH